MNHSYWDKPSQSSTYWDTSQSCHDDWRTSQFNDVRPHVTAHARKRFYERTDICPDEVDEFVSLAVRYGKTWHDYQGIYRQYLLDKASNGCEALVYGGLLLLFAPNLSLVTLYSLPAWFFEQLPHVELVHPHDNNILFRCWKAVNKAVNKAVHNNCLRNRHGSYWH